MRIHRVVATAMALLVLAAGAKGEDAPPEFDARVKPVLALEENAQFAEATARCAELLKAWRDKPGALERLQPIVSRVQAEQRAAEDLGFAATSLVDAQCSQIAEQRFKESDSAGRIILRKAFHDGPDALSAKACAILVDTRDPQLARLCVERLAAHPKDPLRGKWLAALWASVGFLDSATLPEIYTQINDPEIARFVVAAVRRSGDDSAASFARLTHESLAYALLKQRGFLNEAPRDGLTVHLKFDEKKGTQAANSAAENRPRAEIHGAAWADGNGKFNALAFTGSEMVTLNDSALELGRFNADFTVSFWLYLNSGPKDAWRNVTHKGNSDGERTFAIWLHPSDNGMHYRIDTIANNNEGGDTPIEFPLKKWMRVTYVKRHRTLQLYFDANKVGEVDLVAGTVSNTGPLYIGKDPWYAGIDGRIGDYRIYTRALLQSEIQALSAQ